MDKDGFEDGFVRIPNKIFDALMRVNIGGRQRQLFDIVIRKTYGWRKQEDWISLSQFSKITGVSRPNCKRDLSRLEKKKLLNARRKYSDKGKVIEVYYSINQNTNEWKVLSNLITEDVIKTDNEVLSDLSEGVIKSDNRGVIKSDNKVLSNLITTTDINTTDINTTDSNTTDSNTTDRNSLFDYWFDCFMKKPGKVEKDFITELYNKFGYEKTKDIIYSLRESNFHSVRKMKESLDDSGNIKPKKEYYKPEPEWLRLP